MEQFNRRDEMASTIHLKHKHKHTEHAIATNDGIILARLVKLDDSKVYPIYPIGKRYSLHQVPPTAGTYEL